MKFKYPSLDQVKTESDVEQKLIYPLLTNPLPIGLAIDGGLILTKASIKSFAIGKGNGQKNYFPDYCVVSSGLPLLIVEAKSPNVEIVDAVAEARLYCTEVNATFPHGINPCQFFIVSNGKATEGYSWDSDTPIFRFSISDMVSTNANFSKCLEILSPSNISEIENELLTRINPKTTYFKPLLMLGGRSIRNEELEPNSFGTSLSLELRHIFNPETDEERKHIVQNAYVVTRKRQKHINQIDKIIRSVRPASVTNSTEIADSENPTELIKVLKDHHKVKKQVILFIGSVGSGKSTYVDYLREVALPKDLKEGLVWIKLNLNNAPLSKDLIYKWIADGIVDSLINSHPTIDFEERKSLEKVFSVEIRKVKKGEASYFEKNSDQYREVLAKEMARLKADSFEFSKCMIRHLCGERSKMPIIVLDNCDKRKRDDQLLMFDIAKWIQEQFNCVVFLPIRDTTYDNHRDEPPLDTVIKDLAFRIEPPPFMDILHKRIDYGLRQLSSSKDTNPIQFALPNGMVVQYPNNEKAAYLACILKSIYDNDSHFQQIVTGIASRDIRKGLAIFLDFCKSGHISTAEIVKIKQSNGEYALPKHLIIRVLLRGNRVYYDGSISSVKNVFDSNPDDSIPNPFTRIHILQVLKALYRERGPSGILGYHPIDSIVKAMLPYGHSKKRIVQEIEELVKAQCIIPESQDNENFNPEELFTISPAGHVHLDLLTILDYVSACSEDFWFNNEVNARIVLESMSNGGGHSHFSLDTKIRCSEKLLEHLFNFRNIAISNPSRFSNLTSIVDFYDLEDVKSSIARAKDVSHEEKNRFSAQISAYPKGTRIEATIASIQNYGIIFHFGLVQGFCHIAKVPKRFLNGGIENNLETGETASITIEEFNYEHKRFNVSMN